MTYIYRAACAIGWAGVLFAAIMFDSDIPIRFILAIGFSSLALAAWSGWRAGMMQ